MVTTTMFGDLTEDLVMEILLRLPVIAQKRVKLVCKSFYSLINSSEFKAQHSLLLNREPYIILSVPGKIGTHMLSGGPTNLQLELEGLQFHCYSQCCEGVLLVTTIRDRKFALWNPETGDFKPIPLGSEELFTMKCESDFGVGNYGCGFDSKTNEYKPFFVLSTCGFLDLYAMEIMIYSYKMNNFKIIKYSGIMSLGVFWRLNAVVYADGICHWVGFSHLIGREVIISFDISNEVIITTPFPDDIASGRVRPCHHPYYGMHLNGSSFALVKHHRSPDRKHYTFDDHDDANKTTSFDITSFDIWVLGEYGNVDSWTKLFTIGPLNGIEHFLGFWNPTKVFLSDQKLYMIGEKPNCYYIGGKLLLYDTVTRRALELQSIEEDTRVLTCRQRLFPVIDKKKLLKTTKNTSDGNGIHYVFMEKKEGSFYTLFPLLAIQDSDSDSE